MGCKEWQDAIPRVKQPLHLIFFLINVFFPGWGTALAACINESGQFEQCTLIIGVVQNINWWAGWFLSYFLIGFIFILIGWIWAVWWGYLIFQKGK